MTQLACGHGQFDVRRDCVTCLQFTVDCLNKELHNLRVAGTPEAGTQPPLIASLNKTISDLIAYRWALRCVTEKLLKYAEQVGPYDPSSPASELEDGNWRRALIVEAKEILQNTAMTALGTPIGDVRRRLFLNVDDPWNGVVRDVTAKLETAGMLVDEAEVLKALALHLRNQAFAKSFSEAALASPSAPQHPWRVGHKVPTNIYDGDRPVCQTHTPDDAARIVNSVNAGAAGTAPTPPRLNINDTVYVRLTGLGELTEEEWYQGLDIDPKKHIPPTENGWRKFQLWELMNIFGPEMSMANPKQPVFVDNEIRVAEARASAPPAPPKEAGK